MKTDGGQQEGDAQQQQAPDAINHPSPLVQASYSGSGGRYGGRGRFGRGRGRGRGRTHPGRAHVVGMIQAKTWVRKKDDGNEGKSADAATPAE